MFQSKLILALILTITISLILGTQQAVFAVFISADQFWASS